MHFHDPEFWLALKGFVWLGILAWRMRERREVW